MKTPLGFASWNMLIGFLVSWELWIILGHTAFAWGWITIDDSFTITMIFTVTSFARLYVTNKIQHMMIEDHPYIARVVDWFFPAKLQYLLIKERVQPYYARFL